MKLSETIPRYLWIQYHEFSKFAIFEKFNEIWFFQISQIVNISKINRKFKMFEKMFSINKLFKIDNFEN